MYEWRQYFESKELHTIQVNIPSTAYRAADYFDTFGVKIGRIITPTSILKFLLEIDI